jgi:predicted transcriptional regulator
MDANLKEIVENMMAWRKEIKADREAMEVYPEKREANPEEMKSVAVHEEVPEEEAAVETSGALKEQ